MIKIWKATFSNGEDWHIMGERGTVMFAAARYAAQLSQAVPERIKFKLEYVRWVRS
jgi:hypothetical protein